MKEKSPIHSALFPEDKGDSIAHSVKALREQSPDFFKPHGPHFEDVTKKREIYALIAYITERLHPQVESRLKEQGSRIKVYENYSFKLRDKVPKYLDIENLPENPVDFFSRIEEFKHVYSSTFLDVLYEWSENIKKADPSRDAYDAKVYGRLTKLLGDIPSTNEVKHSSSRAIAWRVPEKLLMSGANTASKVSWEILRAIPIAFYKKHNRTIRPDEYSAIAKNTESLIILLSSLHVESFSHLGEFARAGESINRQMGLEFPLELFTIDDTLPEEPWLAFDEKSVQLYEKYRYEKGYSVSEEKRIGCPARDARTEGEGGKKISVVSSVYQMSVRLAEKCLVPHLDRYTEGFLEIVTIPHSL